MATHEEIEEIIAKTITTLHAGNAAVEFTKPKTLQGWLYIIVTAGGILGFLFAAVVFLNNIAEHSQKDFHDGSLELIEKIEDSILDHVVSEEMHRRESVLELKIIKEVSPIKGELRTIQQQVKNLQGDIGQVQQSINKISEKIHQ